MSLTKQFIAEINRANAQKSTGPRSIPGKQRSRMNAVKHNLSGQNLILQESEVEAYNRMSTSMFNDLKPKSEPEHQIAQKIIDTNFRLNRLTAIENNLLSLTGRVKTLAFRRRLSARARRIDFGDGEYRRGAHTVFEIHLHLVWITKYRRPALHGRDSHPRAGSDPRHLRAA